MRDFQAAARWRRVAAAGTGVLLVAVGVSWWLLRPDAPEHSAIPAHGARVAVTAPWTAATLRDTAPAATGPADRGQGWGVPRPGRAGPAAITDAGVPFGYTPDHDGAALAAVNAVVAARWLAPTFPDPWAALGFLADPRFADRGGNTALEAFFTGPIPTRLVDAAAPAVDPEPATPPSGGARVLGVQVSDDPTTAGAVRAVVLWQRHSLQADPDGQLGYAVVLEPISLQLAWVSGDWKVTDVGGPPLGMTATVLGTVPVGFPLPAEGWHQ